MQSSPGFLGSIDRVILVTFPFPLLMFQFSLNIGILVICKRGEERMETSEASTFIYILRLVRREAFMHMSSEEDKIVDEHFEHLKRGLAEGRLILAGPCLDGEFGVVVFRAASREKAEEYMRNDPAVKKGIMIAELHPFRVSLMEKD